MKLISKFLIISLLAFTLNNKEAKAGIVLLGSSGGSAGMIVGGVVSVAAGGTIGFYGLLTHMVCMFGGCDDGAIAGVIGLYAVGIGLIILDAPEDSEDTNYVLRDSIAQELSLKYNYLPIETSKAFAAKVIAEKENDTHVMNDGTLASYVDFSTDEIKSLTSHLNLYPDETEELIKDLK
ncbi:hypothetical protein N9N67_04165 [Bacteriovoracaceae bacterium]|nr:hypothetical protein [Bacteriovoracaceae bacterium]